LPIVILEGSRRDAVWETPLRLGEAFDTIRRMRDHRSHGDPPSFYLEDRAYTVDDVLDAAEFRGELQNFWTEYLKAVAFEAAAESEGREASSAEIQSRSEEFRYRHDLVTTEETENWLGRRAISQSDFQHYFVRRYWLDQRELEVQFEKRPLCQASAAEYDALWAHTFMSGAYEGMARRFCQREAIRHASKNDDLPDAAALAEQWSKLDARLESESAEAAEDEKGWLEAIGRPREWLEDQIKLETLFSMRCRQTLSPRKLAETLARLRMSLLMFEYEVMEVDSHHAAREAYLNITLDGDDMEDLANEHRFPYHRSRSYLEKVPEHLQQSFISCAPGDVIEPMTNRMQLIRINQKTEPTLDDSRINKYIHRRVLNDFLANLESKHVRWALK
jgi:hypothetical protein